MTTSVSLILKKQPCLVFFFPLTHEILNCSQHSRINDGKIVREPLGWTRAAVPSIILCGMSLD